MESLELNVFTFVPFVLFQNNCIISFANSCNPFVQPADNPFRAGVEGTYADTISHTKPSLKLAKIELPEKVVIWPS